MLTIPQQQGEFRCTAKAIYKVTDEGHRLAQWDRIRPLGMQNSPNTSSINLNSDRLSVEGSVEVADKKVKTTDPNNKLHRRISLAERMNTHFESAEKKALKENNSERLRYILEEPGLRSLFREFLRGNFSEENLSFWIDVEDFKKRFNITSSAMATSSSGRVGRTPGQAVVERHHEELVNTAFVIYNTYLAPSSQCELNIDYGLRSELLKYLEEVVNGLTGKAFEGRIEPEQAATFNATQLHTMIRLYERIQSHVFRLMATDSVPKVSVIIITYLSNLTGICSSSRRQNFWPCATGWMWMMVSYHRVKRLSCPKKGVHMSPSHNKGANATIDNKPSPRNHLLTLHEEGCLKLYTAFDYDLRPN